MNLEKSKSGHNLGTGWALPRFHTPNHARTMIYKSGHHFSGGRYTPGEKTLVAEFLEEEKNRLSAQGFVALRGRLGRVLAWFETQGLSVLEVGITEALQFQSDFSQRLSANGQQVSTGTLVNYIKAARRFFDYLVATERRTDNPMRELRYPRLGVHLSRNVLSEAQMGQLLRRLAQFKNLREYRTHVVAELLYATGLRIAEAGALTAADLDLRRQMLQVKHGKDGKSRTAFLGSYSAEVLQVYLDTGRQKLLGRYPRTRQDVLFGTTKARLAEAVNAELEKLCRELDLPVITTHGFRHSLGTHLLRSGCDMRHIQAILGHEALGTTQIYTRVDKEDLKRSLDAFHPRQWNSRTADV